MKAVCTKYSLVNKLILATFFLIVCPFTSKGQTINLVPDPSFEDTLSSISINVHSSLKHWKNLDSNTSLAWVGVYMSFNSKYWPLPINSNVYQYPKSGAGVAVLGEIYGTAQTNKRSIFRTRLKSKLITGKVYCVKISAVYADYQDYSVADGLQLYFDNGGLDTMISIHQDVIGIYPFVKPQVALAKGKVLTDTMNWNLIVGSFVANGTEEFLTIGNFKINDSITRIPIDPNALNPCSCTDLLLDDVSVYPIDLANWLPPSYGCAIGDTAIIGLPNYETPDAKWYTYNMVLIDSGSQIKVVPPSNGTKYICGIDMCNTMVFDTVEVRWWPLAISNEQLAMNNLKVYPNPATNVIQVSNVVGDKVGLYNAIGQLVLEQAVVQNKAVVNVSSLPSGLYFVKDKSRVVKFVKE
jgi:Secretion system C-terminal sorting domain